MQSAYINELLKAILREYKYRYSDPDDYFIKELCLDIKHDTLYIKEKYESDEYDEEIQGYPLIEKKCMHQPLNIH